MEAAFTDHDTIAHKQLRSEGWAPTILPGMVAFFGLLLFLCSPVWAIQVEYVEAKTVPIDVYRPYAPSEKWHATSYEIGNSDEVNSYCANHTDDCRDQDGKLPAMKLCFWRDPAKKTELCHYIKDPGHGYTYEKTKSLKVEELCQRGCAESSGVILDARNESFTVGWIGSVSCWVYDEKLGDFVNIMPPVKFTEQGEYKIFRSLGNGIKAVVVEAEAIVDWKRGETHYSPHRFLISIYKQNPNGYYKEIAGYISTDKYLSLDAVDDVDVIIPELDKIKRLILSKEKGQKK